MARAYSLDLRERVVSAVTAGESCRSVAATFKVSVASVVKWSQRLRERDWLLARLALLPACGADFRCGDRTKCHTDGGRHG